MTTGDRGINKIGLTSTEDRRTTTDNASTINDDVLGMVTQKKDRVAVVDTFRVGESAVSG